MKYLIAIGVFAVGEFFLGLVVFHFIRNKYAKENGKTNREIFKGILERFTIVVGLIHGFGHILIAFGALKLGTRLKQEQESNISNTYFLVGNLTSILLALIESIVIMSLWETK